MSPDAPALPPGIPRNDTEPRDGWRRRVEFLQTRGTRYQHLIGDSEWALRTAFDAQIENFVGVAQIPVGLIGPLRIDGGHAHGDFYVPLATTEGALVAATNRGAKVVSLSGGVRTVCIAERVGRAPAFMFSDLREAMAFVGWIEDETETLRAVAQATTRYGRLEGMRPTVVGNVVYLECDYTTGDAAGQNMVTIATEALCRYAVVHAVVRPRRWFVESNLSGDKKAAARSQIGTRGKRVTAEAVVPAPLLARFLGTSVAAVLEYSNIAMIGGVQSGSIGVQGHYANALAAIFIACGQDVACVAEAAVGITRVDVTDDGDLYIAVSLPNLIVGTVGGGTHLPTQREGLRILGCEGPGHARKLAEICAATVLASELSLTAAITAGHFTRAHVRYARDRRRNVDADCRAQ